MLARYLREMSKPVRYASPYHDPASLQALMNFLAINTRAHEVPQHHRTLTNDAQWPQGAQLLPIYQQHPAMLHAMHSLLQSHHPGDLAAYLDMADEAGIPHMNDEFNPAHVQFIQTLRDLHDEMTHGGGELGVNPNILRQYGHPMLYGAAMRTPLHESLRNPTGSMTPLNRLGSLYQALSHQPGQAARYRELQGHLNNITDRTASPLALVHLHDLADDVLHDDRLPPRVGNWGAGVRADMGDLLHRVVVPTLRGL